MDNITLINEKGVIVAIYDDWNNFCVSEKPSGTWVAYDATGISVAHS